MEKEIKISPVELQSIINAAFFEIARHPESYTIARPKAREIYKWLISTIWDNPEKNRLSNQREIKYGKILRSYAICARAGTACPGGSHAKLQGSSKLCFKMVQAR